MSVVWSGALRVVSRRKTLQTSVILRATAAPSFLFHLRTALSPLFPLSPCHGLTRTDRSVAGKQFVALGARRGGRGLLENFPPFSVLEPGKKGVRGKRKQVSGSRWQ